MRASRWRSATCPNTTSARQALPAARVLGVAVGTLPPAQRACALQTQLMHMYAAPEFVDDTELREHYFEFMSYRCGPQTA
jgi:hypothetical protein